MGLPASQDAIGQLSNPAAPSDHSGRIVVWDEREAHGPVDRTRHLSAKSPNLAHSLLLAWHGYARLKAQKPFEPPRTTQELFNLRTRNLLEREQRLRTGRAGANLTLWQMMARIC